MKPSPMHSSINTTLFREMWEAGVTKAYMADYFGWADERAVWRWVRRLNLKLRGKGWSGECKRA